MKINIFCLSLTLVFSVTLPKDVFAAIQKVYGFKSAIYETQTTGSMVSGSGQGYIDNFGETEWKDETQNINAFGFQKQERTLNFREGYVNYNINREANTATKLDTREVVEGMSEDKTKNFREFNEKMIKEWGGKKIRTERILGKLCDVYYFEAFGMTVWIYKNFPMKTVVQMMGITNTMEVTRFEENARIPKDKKMLPPGIKVVEDLELQKNLQEFQQLQQSPEFRQQIQQTRQNLQQLQQSPQFQQNMQGGAQQSLQRFQQQNQQRSAPIGSNSPPNAQQAAQTTNPAAVMQNLFGSLGQQTTTQNAATNNAGTAVSSLQNIFGNAGQTATQTAQTTVQTHAQQTTQNAVNNVLGALFSGDK